MNAADLIARVQCAVDLTDERLVRVDIREALDEWGTGERPFAGDFVLAVLSNDLTEAVGHADQYNMATIPAIVSYCFNHLPSESWGSREKTRAWAQAHSPMTKSYDAFMAVFNRLHLGHFSGTHYEEFSAAELQELDAALEGIPLGTVARVRAAQLVTMLKRGMAVQTVG